MKGKGTDLNGFLDAGSHLKGELHFEDTFRIDGKFTGTIVSDGDLIVGAGGEVEGEVRTARVFVSGQLRGSVYAANRLEITSQGRVFADLETPALIVEDGAVLEGRCAMPQHPRSSAPAAGPKPVPIAIAKDR